MKSNELLENAIGKIDDDLLFDAEQARIRKPRRIPYFVAAACLTLVLLIIPLGILLANQTETPKVPIVDTTTLYTATTASPTTQTSPQTTKRPSVLDIPGAVVFKENDERFAKLGVAIDLFSSSVSQSSVQKKEWCEEITQNTSMLIGKLKVYTSALVQDGDGYYRISTLEIEISDVSHDIERDIQDETVTVVYVCRYDFDPNTSIYKPSTLFYAGKATNLSTNTVFNYNVKLDMLTNTLSWQEIAPQLYGNTCDSLFFIKSAKEKTVTIENKSYELSDYADYVMEASFALDNGTPRLLLSQNRAISFPFHYLEDAFSPKETKPEKPIPSYDRDAIDMLNAPHSDMVAITKHQDGAYFTIEQNTLVIRMVKDSIVFQELFFNEQTPNSDYAWAVVIDGTVYDITQQLLVTTAAETLVYLDLGEDFDSNKPFEKIILGIYNQHATPYNFDFYADLTQSR